MAFAAIGALFSGAAITASTVLAAVSQIGTIMSVVGAVTGNKTLMKIGGVMGLVGGVGGLINGAVSGATGAAAEAAAGTATDIAADAAAGTATDAANAAAGTATEGLGAVSTPVTGASASGVDLAAMGTDAATGAAPAVGSAANVVAPAADATTAVTGVVTPADTAANLGPAGVTGPADVASPMGASNPTDIRLGTGSQTSPLAPTSSRGYFDGFSNWIEKNPKLVDTATRAGLGFMSGAANSKAKEEELEMARQRMRYGNSVSNFAPGIVNRAAA